MTVATLCETLCNHAIDLFKSIKSWLDANVLDIFAVLFLVFLVSWLFLELSKRMLDFLRKYIDKIKMLVGVMGVSTAILLFFILLQTFSDRFRPPPATTAPTSQPNDCKPEVGKDKKKDSKKVRDQKSSKPIKTDKGKCTPGREKK